MKIEPEIELQAAPKQHTEKEQLMWERDLLGLYISAHPLDKYASYFEEQTLPLNQVQSNFDGQKATIGGIVIDARTIITKAGTKMAFVKLEDKSDEAEVIVFPNLFAEVGAKVQLDAVLRISGKVSARDREGNLKADAQMIAEEILVVTDEELEAYESTGRKMEGLKVGKKPPKQKVMGNRVNNSSKSWSSNKNNSVSEPKKSYSPKAKTSLDKTDQPKPVSNRQVEKLSKLFVHVKNPNDHDALLKVKKSCGKYPGLEDIILVLGEEKKSAIKMPFKIDSNSKLASELVQILGEECVKIV
jgi:DNA polymerase-3 subunit alpha